MGISLHQGSVLVDQIHLRVPGHQAGGELRRVHVEILQFYVGILFPHPRFHIVASRRADFGVHDCQRTHWLLTFQDSRQERDQPVRTGFEIACAGVERAAVATQHVVVFGFARHAGHSLLRHIRGAPTPDGSIRFEQVESIFSGGNFGYGLHGTTPDFPRVSGSRNVYLGDGPVPREILVQ